MLWAICLCFAKAYTELGVSGWRLSHNSCMDFVLFVRQV